MSQRFDGPRIALGVALGLAMAVPKADAAESVSTETIVLFRHGEKPAAGLGQLDCQGLNRALALPAVIQKKFGTPNAIFAPDPAEQKEDGGQAYDYVRPLATIEPTAIAFGLPVNASIGVSNLEALRRSLEAVSYQNALVLVAWEHHQIAKLARLLMSDRSDNPPAVPRWKASDFDSFYVVKIHRNGQNTSASFEQTHQDLDGQPTDCPGPAQR